MSHDAWIDKYIFPNGKLPSAKEITSSLEGRFLIEAWHNFGADYDRTLMAWWENFDKAWPSLEEKYGLRFYRMWKNLFAVLRPLLPLPSGTPLTARFK